MCQPGGLCTRSAFAKFGEWHIRPVESKGTTVFGPMDKREDSRIETDRAKTPRTKAEPRPSLAPLEFEEALEALLAVKPPDGPREIEEAARQEIEYPEDETNEG